MKNYEIRAALAAFLCVTGCLLLVAALRHSWFLGVLGILLCMAGGWTFKSALRAK